MPRSGPGTYALPPNVPDQQPNTTIQSSWANSFSADVEAAFNTTWPLAFLPTIDIAHGGTGSTDGSVLDGTFRIKNTSDPTKIIAIDASGLPTGVTRTWTAPYYSGTLGLVSDIRGQIYGLTLSNNGSDATNDIDIAAGSAVDTTGVVSMLLASVLTKRLDAAWAVGTNQGGLDTGAVGNNVYYVWLIRRPDTGVVDALFSLSNTAPTMPANYTQMALIGSFARKSGVNNYPRSYALAETDWVSYTPTFVGIGTASGVKCRSRRNGPSLEVEVSWQNGTVTASEFSLTLGFNGVNGTIVCASFWDTYRPVLGNAASNVDGAQTLIMIGSGSSGLVNIGIAASGRNPLNPVTGSVLGTGTVINARFSIPIEGWN